ncbi:MAG: hypothetical protein ACRD8A_03870 [Candidatus Acidiferrales bacterium]
MMGQITLAVLLVVSISPAQIASRQPSSQSSAPVNAAQAAGLIVIPSGTPVDLALTSPIWAKTAKPGDPVYAQIIFPVAVHGQMAISPGTYVAGRIDSLTRPGLFSPHASLQISFGKIVFANGYAITLPNAPVSATVPPDVIPAIAMADIDVSRDSTILLDNGSQLRMFIQLPIALDPGRVASALQRSNSLGVAVSAVVCHPTPGTPGTPDTVIPGTPATPGTPDTVIPAGPGQPDIVIPGTPGTSGTPDTVIPGTPGTPGTACPALPVVDPHRKEQKYKDAFQLAASVLIGSREFSPGAYEASWTGLGPSVQVDIATSTGLAAQVSAQLVILRGPSPASATSLRTNPDGSRSVDSIRFGGQAFALYFQ